MIPAHHRLLVINGDEADQRTWLTRVLDDVDGSVSLELLDPPGPNLPPGAVVRLWASTPRGIYTAEASVEEHDGHRLTLVDRRSERLTDRRGRQRAPSSGQVRVRRRDGEVVELELRDISLGGMRTSDAGLSGGEIVELVAEEEVAEVRALVVGISGEEERHTHLAFTGSDASVEALVRHYAAHLVR
jgi:hypothetical protein